MTPIPFFEEARKSFHAALLGNVLITNEKGVPSNADVGNAASIAIALGIASRIGAEARGARLAGQMSGNKFEEICAQFLQETFGRLTHLRPGTWKVTRSGRKLAIAAYDQYAHLAALDRAARHDPELAAALGSDYTITPDVVIRRDPEEDEQINRDELLVDASVARRTSLRRVNDALPILHASISCKWTLRSDRAQNARSEALNLIRNRKGRLPHVVVVTAEPMPSRIASIALGTGDIDCVYHFALPELIDTIDSLPYPDAQDMLNTMVNGNRLRDIADLPLDLVT